jgi:microfibrillar-associated protein 1
MASSSSMNAPTKDVGYPANDDAGVQKSSSVPKKDISQDTKVESSSSPLELPKIPPVSKQAAAQSSSSSESESSDSDSKSSSSSSDDSVAAAPPRPVFVPKHARRLTTAEIEEAQAEAAQAKAQEVAKRRQAASRALVQQVVATAQEQTIGKHDDVDIGFAGARNAKPDDIDEVDDMDKKQEQFDAWQVREVLRLLADWDLEQRRVKEAAERERRRRMTDEERYQEDLASGAYQKPGQGQTEASKGRYFHKGAFYMDDEEWDANDVRHKAAEYARATTESAKIDEKALPSIRRANKFGFAGQPK